MTLEYININGFGVLVDESAEIKEGDLALIPGYAGFVVVGNVDDMPYSEPHRNWQGLACDTCFDVEAVSKFQKSIFAEKELNLDVPILPNWREWEVKRLAEEEFNLTYTEESLENTNDDTVFCAFLDGFVACYNHFKVKHTEDLSKAIQMAWEADSIDGTVDLNVVLKYGNNDDLRTKWTEEEIIQSLQKYPRYIMLESEERFRCSTCNSNDLPKNNYCKSNCKIHSKLQPKLITNSEGKQEGIIKEIIY